MPGTGNSERHRAGHKLKNHGSMFPQRPDSLSTSIRTFAEGWDEAQGHSVCKHKALSISRTIGVNLHSHLQGGACWCSVPGGATPQTIQRDVNMQEKSVRRGTVDGVGGREEWGNGQNVKCT